MRLIKRITNGNRHVSVLRNPDYNEYVCQLFIDGEYIEPADYFSNDKQDALDTAKAMVDPVWPIV